MYNECFINSTLLSKSGAKVVKIPEIILKKQLRNKKFEEIFAYFQKKQ